MIVAASDAAKQNPRRQRRPGSRFHERAIGAVEETKLFVNPVLFPVASPIRTPIDAETVLLKLPTESLTLVRLQRDFGAGAARNPEISGDLLEFDKNG